MLGTGPVQRTRQWILSRLVPPVILGVVCTIICRWVLDLSGYQSVLMGLTVSAGALLAVTWALHQENIRHERLLNERDRMFNLSMDMICVAGFDGYLKAVNPAFERLTGWTREEWQNAPFIEKTHPDDRPRVMEVMKSLSEEKPLLDFESRTLCKDGSFRWFSINSFPVVRDGVVYAICRDITERKHDEETILQLNVQLQERADLLDVMNKELEAFSYSVSHDLRSPLRHIVGFVQLLRKSLPSECPPATHDYLNTIEKSTRHMGLLIDDLLEFSRMGKVDLHLSAVNLRELVDEVLDPIAGETKDRSIDWTIQHLPVLLGDRALIKLVLVNLIGNAVKYTQTRMHTHIEIGTQPATDYPVPKGHGVIFIRDNGVGFNMQYSQRLFGVFQRLHTASEFAGTGIGLANVKRIINRHGGQVWANSKLDEGSTFYFSLPLAGEA